MAKKGIFISFEGGEGAGKSVQIKRLRDKLAKEGQKVVVVREPGGTTISEQIREVLLSTRNVGMAYTTEVLLFQAARAQIYRELIIPSLKAGKYVIADRSRDSSTVYQGIVRGFGVEIVEKLNNWSTENTYPDLTILLDVSVETGLKRRNSTDKLDRLDMEDRMFHENVRRAYLKLAKKNDRKRWVVVDAEKGIDEVAGNIWKEVKKRKIILLGVD